MWIYLMSLCLCKFCQGIRAVFPLKLNLSSLAPDRLQIPASQERKRKEKKYRPREGEEEKDDVIRDRKRRTSRRNCRVLPA